MSTTQHSETAAIVRKLVREATVDHSAFEARLKPCDLSHCRATCCHDGVSLSLEEKDNLIDLVQSNPSAFADILSERSVDKLFTIKPSGNWKTSTRPASEDEPAHDFPAHFPRTRCVFLDSSHRCTVQRFSMANGHSPWFHKPLTCWLHPILIKSGNRNQRPTVTLPSPKTDPQGNADYPGFASCTHCGRPDNDGIPATEALAPELEMLSRISGRDLLGELRAPSLNPAP